MWQKVQVTPPTSSLKPFGGDLRNDRKAVRDISPTNAMAAALIRLMGGLVEGERSYPTKSLFELVPLPRFASGAAKKESKSRLTTCGGCLRRLLTCKDRGARDDTDKKRTG